MKEAVIVDEPRNDWSSLHRAAYYGYVAILKILAEQAGGADLNKLSNNIEFGYTPLHIASLDGHVEVVEALIEQGDDVVDVNKPTYCGSTPIWIASCHGRDKVVRVLIEKGAADVDKANTANGWTPLHIASQYGHVEVVRVLLEIGHANVNKVNKRGKTPLDIALKMKHVKVESVLRDHVKNQQCSINGNKNEQLH